MGNSICECFGQGDGRINPGCVDLSHFIIERELGIDKVEDVFDFINVDSNSDSDSEKETTKIHLHPNSPTFTSFPSVPTPAASASL